MIKPIKNNVVVKAFKDDAISVGGIIIPESYRIDGSKVEIVAVGNGTPKKPMKLEAGRIGYRIFGAGMPIVHEGEKYYILEDNAILALE